MNFNPTEDQQEIANLANKILGDRISPEKIKEMEEAGEWFDRETHKELAKAGLLGLACKEDVGGAGLGLVEQGLVLEAQGRHVAPLPVHVAALAAMALDTFGTEDQRKENLPPLLSGDILITTGIQEMLDDDYSRPKTTAVGKDGKSGEYLVTGTKIVVEFAKEADKIVITADTESDGPQLFLVDMKAEGATGIEMTDGLSTRCQPVHEVSFENTPAEILPDSNVGWLVDRALAFLCATQVGVVSEALDMTAKYTSTREQFGRPIATFQAVTHRLADQYINTNGVRLTAYSLLWKLENGQAGAKEVHCAKWYSSERAQMVADACQHVHGGMGVDKDYPLHRYTLWNKHIESSLGAGVQQLRHLGKALALA